MKFKLPIKSRTNVNRNILANKIITKNVIKKSKFKLPKKSKKYVNTFINANSSNRLSIQLNNQLKPKNVSNVKDKYISPQYTLRVTKFEHYISSKELMAASIQQKTSKTYLNYGKAFYSFIAELRTYQNNLPLIKDILNNFDIFQLDVLIYEFLTAKFNEKSVTGGTLHNTACGILYSLAVDFGISLTCELLPGTRRICKGADNVLRARYGDHPKGKYPILNPILEAMLKVATEDEQFAILMAQRFCLRSQHYCNNRKENVITKNHYIKVKNLKFIPNIEDPRAIAITTSYDKNNPTLEHMERVVYCCCKHTKWTCVVHVAKQRFEKFDFPDNAALLQCRSGDMHYRAMLAIVKSLIKKIGLNPDNYGTHSFRSGGTTELFLIGKQAVWIQHFGWWNNIGSVMIYIRPNNPDLSKFVNSTLEYTELRNKEGGVFEQREKNFSNLQHEIVKQNKKRVKGNRHRKILRQAVTVATISESRIAKLSKAMQRNIRIHRKYNTYNEHTYIKKNDRWEHNPNDKPRMVVSPIGDVRTVTINPNDNNQWENSYNNFPFSNNNYDYNYYNQFNNDITGQYVNNQNAYIDRRNSYYQSDMW